MGRRSRARIKIWDKGKRIRGKAQLVAANPWIVDLDPVDLADEISEATEREMEARIKRGEFGRKANGQPRGYTTGRLASSFNHAIPRARGDFVAVTRVAPVGAGRDRLAYVAIERNRGRDYLAIDTARMEKIIDRTILRWLRIAMGTL